MCGRRISIEMKFENNIVHEYGGYRVSRVASLPCFQAREPEAKRSYGGRIIGDSGFSAVYGFLYFTCLPNISTRFRSVLILDLT